MGRQKCSTCGARVSSADNYCPSCGSPLREGDDHAADSGGGGGCMHAFLVSFFLVLLLGSALAGYYWYTTCYTPEVVTVTPGLRDAAGRFDRLGEFYDGVACVYKGDTKAYINTAGEVVDAPADDSRRGAFHTSDETTLTRIERDGRWGMIDRETRDTVIRPLYTTLGSFYDGLALATIKFGDKSMPEYTCYYGYVDTRGGHTFTPEQFRDIERARQRAERREYLSTLPQGITAHVLGLPEGVKEAVVPIDSARAVTLRFDRRGVLTHYIRPDRHYGVSGGFVTSMSLKGADGVIRTYRFLREKADALHEAIIRQGADGRTRVGAVEYSADDGTVTNVSFEQLTPHHAPPARISYY